MGLFSSIGNIVGGVLGFKQSKKQHSDQMALANAQVQFQQDYAKNRLQWQVEDAKKAGLHPMVAAGLSPTSFSPVSYPTSPTDYSWVSNIGQNLDYAATKAKTGQQMSQAAQLMQQSQEAVVDGQELDNELKRMEIEAMKARLANAGPVAPTSNHAPGLIPGQDESSSPYMDKPIIRDGWLLDEKGRKISIIPSDDLKARTEDVLGVEWLPFIGSAYRDAKARVIGHEVNGHWWHGLDKGYLPYPPKNGGSRAKVSDYYSRSYRY